MKKIFASLICFNFLAFQAVFALTVFEDNLANNLDKNLKVEYKKQPPIVDDFALRSLNSNLKIEQKTLSKIEDNLVNKLDKNLAVENFQKRPLEDNLVLQLNGKKEVNSKYSSDSIRVSPLVYYTTKSNLFEGDLIDFVLVEDFKMGKMTYKKGTKIKARVETVSKNASYGVPADLVVGNFTLPNNFVLSGTITKQGANRALWVYPMGYLLTSLFLIGLPIFAIRGGHAKLKPAQVHKVEI